MLESYVLNSVATRHDMDSVARHYLGVFTLHFTWVVTPFRREERTVREP